MSRRDSVIFICQDESVYHAKDTVWRTWSDGFTMMRKGTGKGIMVSAWFDCDGILSLDDETWQKGKETNPNLAKEAIFIHQFGKEWGYYTWDKFQRDLDQAISITKLKYPQQTCIFMYDHSSVHKRCTDNALNARRMNLRPGGKQPKMRPTIWNGHPQSLIFPPDHPLYANLPKGA